MKKVNFWDIILLLLWIIKKKEFFSKARSGNLETFYNFSLLKNFIYVRSEIYRKIFTKPYPLIVNTGNQEYAFY